MTTHLFDQDTTFVTYPENTYIFNEGDKPDVMFAVQTGKVDIVIHGRVVETIGPGGLFGEMALIDNSPRSASALTISESRIVRIDRARFLFLVQQTPFFALHMLSVLTDRLRRMDDRIAADVK